MSSSLFFRNINYIKTAFTATIFLLVWTAANAAVEVEIVNERVVKNKKHVFIVKGIFDGEKVRYTFHTDDNSEIISGTSIISLDGGKTNYFIGIDEDSEDNEVVCHLWTNKESIEILGKYLLKVTGKFNVKVSDPVINKVFEKKAKAIHGLPTKHVRLKMNFNASYKFLFFDDILKVERKVDHWLTPKVEGIEAKPILQQSYRVTGYKQMDEVLNKVSKFLKGYKLRSEVVQTITDKKGKVKETRITQYIKSINTTNNLAEDAFKLPSCTKVDSYDMEQQVKHVLFVLAGKPL